MWTSAIAWSACIMVKRKMELLSQWTQWLVASESRRIMWSCHNYEDIRYRNLMQVIREVSSLVYCASWKKWDHIRLWGKWLGWYLNHKWLYICRYYCFSCWNCFLSYNDSDEISHMYARTVYPGVVLYHIVITAFSYQLLMVFHSVNELQSNNYLV